MNPDPVNPDPGASGQLVLRDIHVPVTDWWPPAPGWWLAAVGLLLLLYLLIRFGRGWLVQRRRHKAISVAYQQVRDQLVNTPGADSVSQASEFLRRVALRGYPRHEVAGLSGDAWLRFLDESGGGDRFTRGPGAVLGNLAYRPDADTDFDAEALAQLIQDWLQIQFKRRGSSL